MNVSAFIIAASVLLSVLIVTTIILFIIKKNKGGSSSNGAQGPQGRVGTSGTIGPTGVQGVLGSRGVQGFASISGGGSSNTDGQLPSLTYNNFGPDTEAGPIITLGGIDPPDSIDLSTAYRRINRNVIISGMITFFVVLPNKVNFNFDIELPEQAPLNSVDSVISFEGLATPERQVGTATNVDLVRVDVPNTTRITLHYLMGNADGSLWNGAGAAPSYRTMFTVTYFTTPQ